MSDKTLQDVFDFLDDNRPSHEEHCAKLRQSFNTCDCAFTTLTAIHRQLLDAVDDALKPSAPSPLREPSPTTNYVAVCTCTLDKAGETVEWCATCPIHGQPVEGVLTSSSYPHNASCTVHNCYTCSREPSETPEAGETDVERAEWHFWMVLNDHAAKRVPADRTESPNDALHALLDAVRNERRSALPVETMSHTVGMGILLTAVKLYGFAYRDSDGEKRDERCVKAMAEVERAANALCAAAPPVDTPSPGIAVTEGAHLADLVRRAKDNWCAATHRHGMLADQQNAIDELARLAALSGSPPETRLQSCVIAWRVAEVRNLAIEGNFIDGDLKAARTEANETLRQLRIVADDMRGVPAYAIPVPREAIDRASQEGK